VPRWAVPDDRRHGCGADREAAAPLAAEARGAVPARRAAAGDGGEERAVLPRRVSIVAHTPGRFVWRERTTPDAGIAREFYSELLGWTWEEVQSIDGPYWVAYADETRVGGLWRPPSGASMPGAWNSDLSVEDVDAITRRAQEMGWKVFRPPTEIPGIGRFSVIADFAGAAVLPYRNVGPDPSPGEVAPPGAFCWESLVTSDIPRAL